MQLSCGALIMSASGRVAARDGWSQRRWRCYNWYGVFMLSTPSHLTYASVCLTFDGKGCTKSSRVRVREGELVIFTKYIAVFGRSVGRLLSHLRTMKIDRSICVPHKDHRFGADRTAGRGLHVHIYIINFDRHNWCANSTGKTIAAGPAGPVELFEQRTVGPADEILSRIRDVNSLRSRVFETLAGQCSIKVYTYKFSSRVGLVGQCTRTHAPSI